MLGFLKGRGWRDRLMRATLPGSGLPGAGRVVLLDYPVAPRVRPRNPHVAARIAAGDGRYAALLDGLSPLAEAMGRIPARDAPPGEPQWENAWFLALDAIALYGLIATRRPRRFVEIGSGTSTLFARRAIRDHGLSTRIVSVDPAPRAEVDAICDEVQRCPLEALPVEFFADLTADDLLFFDGSHRLFQNSDVAVFFTEIMPLLPRGLVFGVHDVFLPDDYPEHLVPRWYSEQYMLSATLLGGDRYAVELPVWHCTVEPALKARLAPFWGLPALAGARHEGSAFWMRVT